METTKKVKKWMGSPIEKCQLCEEQITARFVDGATLMGPWAIMCTPCHGKLGVGIGTGRGQLYQHEGTDWVKVAG